MAAKRNKKRRPSAHDVVKPAVGGLVARTRAAADRVIHDITDPEAVHDFRVGLRRLRTVLRAARGLYGKAALKPHIEAVKRFGDATNALRDEEVLDDTIAMTRLEQPQRDAVRTWLDKRRLHETDLRQDAIELIAGPDLNQTLASLMALVERGCSSEDSAAKFAKKRLRSARQGVIELLPVDPADVERLHRLRIRFKRLRYTSEMLGSFITQLAAAAALKKDAAKVEHTGVNYAAVAKLASRMQKDLGLLHDADVALDTVVADTDLDDATRRALRVALLTLRDRLVERAIARLEAMPVELLGRAVPPTIGRPSRRGET